MVHGVGGRHVHRREAPAEGADAHPGLIIPVQAQQVSLLHAEHDQARQGGRMHPGGDPHRDHIVLLPRDVLLRSGREGHGGPHPEALRGPGQAAGADEVHGHLRPGRQDRRDQGPHAGGPRRGGHHGRTEEGPCRQGRHQGMHLPGDPWRRAHHRPGPLRRRRQEAHLREQDAARCSTPRSTR